MLARPFFLIAPMRKNDTLLCGGAVARGAKSVLSAPAVEHGVESLGLRHAKACLRDCVHGEAGGFWEGKTIRSTKALGADRGAMLGHGNGERNEAMSFDTPNGSRGARQPGRSRIERWGNKGQVNRIRRNGSPERAKVVVLVTVGSKTGAERATPVRRFPRPDGSTLIVASASGAARNPSWYFNLAAHPDQARIEFAGQRIEVTAEQLHGPERDAAWKEITATVHGYARYEKTTDRVIPVIRLTPRAETPGE